MTPLQIFMTYAKIRDIIPAIHKLAICDLGKTYRFNRITNQYKLFDISFKDIFNEHFSTHGFGGSMFYFVLSDNQGDLNLFEKPCVVNAERKWNTFVKNNIIFDGNVKVGSRVKYRWWDNEHTGTIQSISNDFSNIKILRDDGSLYDQVPPGSIIEVDDEPAEFSFHIKWKGKEYGNK